jgi:hypothetical protein
MFADDWKGEFEKLKSYRGELSYMALSMQIGAIIDMDLLPKGVDYHLFCGTRIDKYIKLNEVSQWNVQSK